MPSKPKDIVGKKFGRLTVVGDTGRRTKSGDVIWRCLCDCGGTNESHSGNLRGGSVASCGCIQHEPRVIRWLERDGWVEDRLLPFRRITESGCWEWTGKKDKQGYGLRCIGGCAGAHRIAYVWWVGSVPKDYHVCHKCDNPSCFNPDHLFVGTPKDNAQDMQSKGRKFLTQGSTNGMAVLTEIDVVAIRAWLKLGAKAKDLATFYSVSDGTIFNIRQRRSWTHVPEEP